MRRPKILESRFLEVVERFGGVGLPPRPTWRGHLAALAAPPSSAYARALRAFTVPSTVDANAWVGLGLAMLAGVAVMAGASRRCPIVGEAAAVPPAL